jgi:hypothetical protein
VDIAVVCKPPFKKLVEAIEPGVHLFAPVTLQFVDGSEMEGEFYYFNCQTDIDCIITDNQPEWFWGPNRYDGTMGPAFGLIQKLTPIDIRLAKPQIQGHHLWTGGILGWNQLLISDEFYRICQKAKFRGWLYWRECEEIDRPWIAEEHMGPLLDIWKDYVASGRTKHQRWG